MVEDTGKALRSNTFKPVNLPEPVKVEETAAGQPKAVRSKRRLPVTDIDDHWRIDDEWWRAAPVSRAYYNVLLSTGRRMILYKDLVEGSWYEQEY